MIELFNASIANDRFNLNDVYNDIFQDRFYLEERYRTLTVALITKVGARDAKKIIKGLLRYSFFIEPVKKPKIETTKFEVRWSNELDSDPRYATYETCQDIFYLKFQELIEGIDVDENKEMIKNMVNKTNVSYEIPLDYVNSNVAAIHNAGNINWLWDALASTVVMLRNFLTNPEMHGYSEFFKGVYKKVKTKTYLTDRVLTGLHKTNREKRWECHPESVHFALRRVAWEIEVKLIKQVCHFYGFPEDLKTILEENEIIQFDDQSARCPITFEPLSFNDFRNEIENTIHGKSDFQVGHMNPLKADSDEDVIGHSHENISWISEQGNRIQGSNSVEYTRETIIKIYKNYRDSGLEGI